MPLQALFVIMVQNNPELSLFDKAGVTKVYGGRSKYMHNQQSVIQLVYV